MQDSKAGTQEIAKRDLIEGLIKGIDVITAFNEEAPRLTASEVAQRVGLTRSAARRYLLTLVHIGLATSDGRNFWLTPKVMSLGRSYLDASRVPRAVVPFLERLSQQLQESTNFAVLDGDEIVYVSRVNAPRLLTTGLEPGTRLPAYTSAAGRVLLSAKPDEELQAWIAKVEMVAFTHLTLVDKQKFYEELLKVRKEGYCLTENQYEVGLRGISVPVKNRHGNVIGALSVSTSIVTHSSETAVAKCVPALQATANTLMKWI